MLKTKFIIAVLFIFIMSERAFSQLGLNCSTSTEQIKRYDEHVMNYKIHENNLTNKMVWEDADLVHSLAGMYKVTGNLKYLDKMIEFVDDFESKKNNTETGVFDFYMKKRVPSWLSYTTLEKPVAGNVYTNVIQTSMLLLPITTCAKIILSEPELLHRITKNPGFTGSTYGEKANYYIESSLKSVNFFIDNGWLNEDTHLFQSRSRISKVYHPVRNPIEPLAFNRMFNMGRVMKELALACELTNRLEYKDYINLTETVVNSMVGYLKDNITTGTTPNNLTQYFWYYKVRKRGNNVYEDTGHLGLDIDCLHYFYSINPNTHYGLSRSDMRAISNTVLHSIYTKEKNGFYFRMNGTDKVRPKWFSNFMQLSYHKPKVNDLICKFSKENNKGFSYPKFVQLMKFKHGEKKAIFTTDIYAPEDKKMEVMKTYNFLGQEISKDTKNVMKILIYNDGSKKKVIEE